MRLLPKDVDFGTLASALSLAAANYKPIPQLPASSSAAPLSTVNAGQGSQSSGLDRGYSFKTQPSNGTDTYASSHPVDEWGEPSTLFVPVSANGTVQGHTFKAGRTVGPGNCPFSNGYTPKGGWDSLPPPTFPPFDPVKATIMRYRQQQAVNLGTWFVQEGWMESGFMSCATGSKQAEFDLLDGFGYSGDGVKSARAYLEEHWDTFFTEADFANLASRGINTIRLPIGYWSVGPYFCHSSPFDNYKQVYEYSWRYIARAINWAAKYDIGVLIDLHGAYGSQNGQPHSGLSDGNIEWYNDYNQGLTTELLVWLANEISDVTNVVGIELLNEPQNRDSYWTWLPKAMDAMRNASPYAATIPLYFHDAFVLNKGAKFVSRRNDFVISDHHSYYVYTDADQATSAQGHISQLDGQINQQFESASSTARRNLVVGEWSCALATSSLKVVKDKEAAQKDFCETQRIVWETQTAGWMFWSHKLENCKQNAGWCFQGSMGRYLPSEFNVWDLPITPFSLDTADAKAALQSSALMQAINAIKLPASSNATSNAQPAKSLKAIPRIGKVTDGGDGDSLGGDTVYDGAAAADDDDEDHDQAAALLAMSRIGTVPFNPQPTAASIDATDALRRRGGSTTQAQLWARGARLFRRAASQSPAVRGYKDGFYSTKIFAASGDLSRLGFAQQYRQDTWNTYVTAGVYTSKDEERYKQQFLTGAQAGETAISYVITQKGNRPGSASAGGSPNSQLGVVPASSSSGGASSSARSSSDSASSSSSARSASAAASSISTSSTSCPSSATATSSPASSAGGKTTAASPTAAVASTSATAAAATPPSSSPTSSVSASASA